MATIPSTTNAIRHVRKTITFTGGANLGLLGDEVPVFTKTGRVRIEDFTIFCSDALVCAAGGDTTLKPFLGGVSWASAEFFVNAAATGTWADDNTTGFRAGYGIAMPSRVPVATDANVSLMVRDAAAGANITGGTIIVTAWYLPESDDGALAGDDIDAGYMPADVKAWLAQAVAAVTVNGVPEVDVTHWLGTAAATPTVAGVPEVDLTHVAGSTTSVSALASGVATLLADWINGGRLDIILDIISADTTTDIPATLAAIAGYLDTEIAAIKAVTDLLTAAHAEPTGVPAADETPLEKLGYLFMALRNKVTVTATKKQFFDDGGAAEWEKDLSDDGTTYTETEGNAI